MQALAALTAQGCTLAQAAERLGIPAPTLCRWRLAWERSDRDPIALKPKSTNAGRRPDFELSDEETAALRHLRLQRGGLPLAVEEFVRHPACQPETRERILAILDAAARARRAPSWPPSLKRAAHVRPEEEALFRGAKTFQHAQIANRRGLFYRDEAGVDQPMVAEDIWESDDYSCNAPYYIEQEEGVRLCRQMLCTMDVLTAGWRGVDAVGRERDAYRAEDILRHMLRTIDGQGTMPRIWRLERGTWESQAIDGVKLSDGTIWGGLGALFHVVHVFSSRGKGLIESSFNLLQNCVDHRSATIGRSRGEFEAAAKQHLRINGNKTPTSVAEARKAGFWSALECANEHFTQMTRLNQRPRERGSLGGMHVPEDLRVSRPGIARPLPTSERWRFCPVKREATVRGGFVEISVDKYPMSFRFMVNGVSDVYLENGFRVLVAFDPAEPTGGCHIFNAERGSKNRDGWRFAEKLFLAPAEGEIPQVDLSRTGDFSGRKKANAAARTEFRAIVAPGRKAARVSQLQDGRGNLTKIEVGMPERDPSESPAEDSLPTNEFPERSKSTPEATPRIESWMELLKE